MRQIRQGDIMLVEVSLSSWEKRDLKKIKSRNGRLIIALGEATGHHHSVKASPTTALMATSNDEMFLMVKQGEALLEHQEHRTAKLKSTTYKVIRQREYDPAAERRERRVRD